MFFFLHIRAQDYFLTDTHMLCLKLSWTPGKYVDVRVTYAEADGTPKETLVRCGFLEHEGTEQELFVPYDNEIFFYDEGPDSVYTGQSPREPQRVPGIAPERVPPGSP